LYPFVTKNISHRLSLPQWPAVAHGHDPAVKQISTTFGEPEGFSSRFLPELEPELTS